jgi:mono/diheme cytochrome c family protein
VLRRAGVLGFVAVLRRAGVLGFVAVALLATGCGAEGIPDDSGASQGRELFSTACGSCHVIGDAQTQGRTGPNLDDAFEHVRREGFDESSIRALVRNQIQYPVENPVTGQPGMPGPDTTLPECKAEDEPANCVEDQDEAADAIAAYVASVAGTEASAQAAGGEIEATEGRAIFASAGCGSCHVLADADASGTIGPNLDQSQPSVELAIERVTNGSGQMPSFRDRLTEAQIRAVAEYVSEAAEQ